MQNTTNYNLKKPELTDYVNISDFNDNADIIDAKLKENEDALETHRNEDSATETELGHVKVGQGLTISDDGTLRTKNNGELVIEKFDTPGAFTWAVPEGITRVYVSGCGGGGGGGGYHVYVNGTHFRGGTGGATSFGSYLTLSGGLGGSYENSMLNIGGNSQTGGYSDYTSSGALAPGGNSLLGSGGLLATYTNNPIGFGSGGQGIFATGTSGNILSYGGHSGQSCIDVPIDVVPNTVINITIGRGGAKNSSASTNRGSDGQGGLLILKYII